MKGQITLYNLPTEIKLHILSFLPYKKELYIELNCNYIPKNIIKNHFISFVLILLPKKPDSINCGIYQLVAYGAQDVYLVSNPQVSFFNVVYRRY